MLQAMPEPKKDPAAARLGRKGGLARAKALTAEERRASAVVAIRARWAKAEAKAKAEARAKAKRRKRSGR